MAKKFYAVKNGRVPGIYPTWDDCKAQVDGYPKAVYKSFPTETEALSFLNGVQPPRAPRTANARRHDPSHRASVQPPRAPRTAHPPKPECLSPQEEPALPSDGIVVYTDGSCLKNPGGPGGYAAVILLDDTVREITGAEPSTTNNRMEMRAAIEALRFFDTPTTLILHTDSQYLRNGLAKGWVANWKRNGWITKAGTPVLNKELWQELDSLNSFHRVIWKWVKGHHGNPLNERCDELAVGAATNEAKKTGWKSN